MNDLLVSEMRRVNKETIRERKRRERRTRMKRKKENENEEKDDVEWGQQEKERKGRNELVLSSIAAVRDFHESSIVFFASLLLTRGNPEYRPELTDDIMV